MGLWLLMFLDLGSRLLSFAWSFPNVPIWLCLCFWRLRLWVRALSAIFDALLVFIPTKEFKFWIISYNRVDIFKFKNGDRNNVKMSKMLASKIRIYLHPWFRSPNWARSRTLDALDWLRQIFKWGGSEIDATAGRQDHTMPMIVDLHHKLLTLLTFWMSSQWSYRELAPAYWTISQNWRRLRNVRTRGCPI